MKKCEIVYLDQNGNRSGAYYNNLHLGQNEALSIYLDSMKEHVYTKFQKKYTNFDEFLIDSKRVVKPQSNVLDETKRKFVSPSGVPLKGVTRTLNESKNPFVERQTAKELVIRNRALELIHTNPKDYGLTAKKVRNKDFRLEDHEEAIMQANLWAYGEYYNKDVDSSELNDSHMTEEFQKRTKKVLDLWSGKTELGTQIHAVIEEFVKEYSALEKDEDGEIDSDIAIAKAIESTEITPKLTAQQKIEYQKLLPQIEKFMDNIGRGKKLRFETEVAIYDEELGVGGFVDLMAIDTESGDIYIFDFKTKEKGKEWLFSYRGEKRIGATKDLWDNKETDGALQTSLYRLMMERKGFKVLESNIVYIEGDIEEDKTTGNYYYKSLEYKKTIPLRYYYSVLDKLFKLNKPRVQEPGKLNNINQMLDSVADQNLWERSEKNIKRAVLSMLNSLQTDEKTGVQYFYNQSTGKREYFKINATESEKTERLTNYLQDQDSSIKELTSNVIDYFHSGKTKWRGGGRNIDVAKNQADALLAGINSETHTLERLNNSEGFSEEDGVSSDILLAIDKRDRTATIINVNRREPSKIDIKKQVLTNKKGKVQTENEASVNLFSRKFSDETLQRKYGITGLESTDEDFRLLRAGVLALELMDRKIVDRVDMIRNGSITGKQTYSGNFTPPKNVGMHTMLKHLKVLNDFTTEDQSTYYKRILNDSKLIDAKKYRRSFLNNLHDLLNSGLSEMKSTTVESLKKDITNWNKTGGLSNKGMLQSLIEAQTELGKAHAGNESRAASEDYILLSQTILQLANINLSVGVFTEKLSWDNRYTTTSRIGNEAVKQLDLKVKATKNVISRKFKDYKRKHKNVYEALVAEAKQNNVDVREWMKQLYIVNPDERSAELDKKEVDNLFVLRDVKDTSLSNAQRDYIKFFNETVIENFKLVLPERVHESLDKHQTWREGAVPIIHKGSATKIHEAEGLKKKIKESIGQSWNRNVKNDKETYEAINTRIEYPYRGQVGEGINGGKDRLKELGLDPEGNRYEGFIYDQNETNLEAILNNFVNDSLRTTEYEETLGIYNAMNTIAFLEEKGKNFHDVGTVRQYLDEYIKLIVFNEVNKEGSQVMDKAGKVMTMMSLGFSPKQVFLEGVTNLFATTGSILQQSFMGKDKRYSASDWAKAGQIVTGRLGSNGMSLADAIASSFGIYNADSEAFGTQDFMESAKNDLWQSKWAYALNNLPFKFVKQQSFIAELNKQGILEALSVDEETGVLKYDYTSDVRFKDIFHGGKIVQHFDTAEKRQQKALLDYLIKNLREEDEGLDELGMPSRPLTMTETLSMIDYGRSVYGSLDSDQKVLAQLTSFGRMFLKFKNWVIAKKDNYYTRSGMSELKGERKPVYNEAGEIVGYDWEAETVEGIFQTLGHFTSIVGDMMKGKEAGFKDFPRTYSNLNKNQRENLAKLASDAVIVAILTGLFSMLFDDEFFKRGEGKLLSQTLMNATNDLNMLGLAQSLIDGSPVATLSFISRTLSNTYESVAYTATGDLNKGFEKFMKTTGITKTVYAFVE